LSVLSRVRDNAGQDVRDALEQIDLVQLVMKDSASSFQLGRSAGSS